MDYYEEVKELLGLVNSFEVLANLDRLVKIVLLVGLFWVGQELDTNSIQLPNRHTLFKVHNEIAR